MPRIPITSSRILLTGLAILTIYGCRYFRRDTVYYKEQDSNKKLEKSLNKSFYGYKDYTYVVHLSDSVWELKDVRNQNNVISGAKIELPEKKKYFYQSIDKRPSHIKRVKRRYENDLYQFHLYVDNIQVKGNWVTIQKSAIQKIDVYKNDGISNTMSAVGTVVLVTGGSIGLAFVYVSIACGCPHAYIENDGTYQFANGLFVGSIAPQIERHDYKVIPDPNPVSNELNLLIKNEEQEVQHTNLLELMVVTHEKGTRLAPDQSGGMHAFKDLVWANAAVTDNGTDVSEALKRIDNAIYSNQDMGENNLSNVYLTYPTKDLNERNKLILSVSNNEWSKLVYEHFSSMFGTYYDDWVKKNRKKPAENMLSDIKKLGLPLVVSVKTNSGWEEIDVIYMMGSPVVNTIAVDIDPKFITQQELEIRLSTGFMFWNIDEAVIATNVNSDLVIHRISPEVLSGDRIETEKDLSSDDSNYMVHHNGDSVSIRFGSLPVSKDLQRSFILHSKGYYVSNKEYSGTPQLSALKSIDQPGGLSILSNIMYRHFALPY